jgi:hypothetical protein
MRKAVPFIYVAAAVLIVMASLFLPHYEGLPREARDTRVTVFTLRHALEVYHSRIGLPLAPSNELIVAVLEGKNITGLNPQQEKLIVFSHQKLDKKGRLLDTWDRPIHFLTNSTPGQTLLVYSVGPNGIDEGGRGDDVTSW